MIRCLTIVALCLPVLLANGAFENEAQSTRWLEKINHRLKVSQIDRRNRILRLKSENQKRTVEPPLHVGSFNIQTLGSRKFNDATVMSTVENVILRYDLILIMEIMLQSQKQNQIGKLLTVINRLAPSDVVYNFTASTSHPATAELNAFFYRTDKLKVVNTEEYPNRGDEFYRKPFIVHFKSSTLRDMEEFVAVGHHVKPNKAVGEINALASVYDYIKEKYNIEDVLIMGDFNADCTYVKEQDWGNISLWTRLDFTWPIKTHVDTTTNYKSCALDRFVYAGDGMNNGVIMSSAQPFNFQEAYGLTIEETRAVSDHWPIEIRIRGKLSNEAERHLTSNMCISVNDSRPNIKAKQLEQQVKASGFNIEGTSSGGKVLHRELYSINTVIEALQTLNKTSPGIISKELLESIVYKVTHHSLQDLSSHADLIQPVYTVTVKADRTTEVYVCSSTTIN